MRRLAVAVAFFLTARLGSAQDLDFFALTPCRLVDTRLDIGPLGGPALQHDANRTFPLAGTCGLPASAAAVSLNVTAVDATGGGQLTLFPADISTPATSTISFSAGRARANNCVLGVAGGGAGELGAAPVVAGGGTVQMILDVNGYFRDTCGGVPDGQDPEGDCGAVGCAGHYWGFAGDTCYRKADVGAAQASCGGDSECRTVAEECSAQTSQGPAATTCNPLCQDPSPGTCTGITPGLCTNVNAGNTSCGTGECRRTVAACENGTPNTCIPGDPTAEQCDGLDNDCSGLADDGLAADAWGEPNSTCPASANLGDLHEGNSWSANSPMSIYPQGDVDWYRQRTYEISNFCLFGEGPYYYTATLTPPAGKTYVLEVCWALHDDPSCTNRGCSSVTVLGPTPGSAGRTWMGACSAQDGLDFYIRVYPTAGATNFTCTPYTLTTEFTKAP